MKQLAKLILVLFIISTLLQNFYRVNPASAFSVGDEREIGEQLLTLVRREFNLIDEPDIIQYINELGRATLEVAGSQYFDYHFFVINNKELNAFAAPSGLIFFHSGLIQSFDSEGELVGGDVTANNALDRQWLGFLDQHAAAFELIAIFVRLGREIIDIGGHNMVRHDVGHLLEPEDRELIEDNALLRDAFVHDDIERRKAVGGHQQKVLAKVVDVTYFAAIDQVQVGHIGFENDSTHLYFSLFNMS